MELITIPGLSYQAPSLTAEAIKARNALVAEAAGIITITDEITAGAAAAILKDIATSLASCEAARKLVKTPVDELAGKIQEVAKSYAGPLTNEKDRLSRILGAYQQAKREEHAKAEREAQEAAARIRDEEERKIEAAAFEHGENSAEVQQAVETGTQRVAEARQEIANVAAPKIEGTALKKTWAWELTDINALFAARPDLVTLTPDKTAIRAALKKTQSIPGLRIFEDVKTIIR
ncbi:hypothetical protein [Geminisphaera colitermitum]|uniref:hypothetical protein n=1 Tax=Geminisphaera colitermitum TaxID=1148786 RepID=UPI0001964E5D|nr:hypothetical protein [Geminisphaera colitermitum]